MMGLFDYNPPDPTMLAKDYKPGILDALWYDPDDRRYNYDDDPHAYDTTAAHLEFMEALESNPNAAAPPGYDPMIEAEDREIARMRRGD